MKKRLLLLLSVLLLPGVLSGFRMAAAEYPWSNPFRLSNPEYKASEASLVADPFGYAHVFWAEELPNLQNVVQYARFDGQTWSFPIDIYLGNTNTPIKSISSAVDSNGILHVAWTEGLFRKFISYSRATDLNALSSQKWLPPINIRIPAETVRLQVDAQGTLHILFTRIDDEGRGVYYIRSQDEGKTWSTPLWLDPDLPPQLVPGFLNFALDQNGGLHAVWAYQDLETSGGDWVRYARSLDGGDTWEPPVTIARNSPGDAPLNGFARPVMAISGQTVHIVWAGGDLLYRNHRYSTDRGTTWSEPTRILGSLNGQAGDGMAVDGAGRVHYFSQIRFPKGIYHTIWDGDRWTPPALIYLIQASSTDPPIEGQVEAHSTFPVVRAGNQLILTFTDPPPDEKRGLYVMTRTLTDIPPQTAQPTPTVAPTATPQPTPTIPATPTATPTIPSPAPIEKSVPVSDTALWFGPAFSLAVVAVIAVAWSILRRRQ